MPRGRPALFAGAVAYAAPRRCEKAVSALVMNSRSAAWPFSLTRGRAGSPAHLGRVGDALAPPAEVAAEIGVVAAEVAGPVFRG